MVHIKYAPWPHMTLYSVDKLMAQTRVLANQYHATTGLTLPVTAELAKYDLARLLDCTKPEVIESGVDLIGGGKWLGQKIQVKARTLFTENKNSKPRIGQLSLHGKWQVVMLVLYDAQYEPIEIIACSRETLQPELTAKSINPRGAMSLNKFKALGEVIWFPSSP